MVRKYVLFIIIGNIGVFLIMFEYLKLGENFAKPKSSDTPNNQLQGFIDINRNEDENKHDTNNLENKGDDDDQIPYNIFFMEINKNKKVINPKALCTIESAAKVNPDAKVYIFTYNQILPPRLIMDKYPNIVHKFIDIDELIEDERLRKFWDMNVSRLFITHISDILRYILLWKFGGIYTDLDAMHYKSVKELLSYDFICARAEVIVSNFLVLRRKSPFLDKVIEALDKSYDPQSYYSVGPALLAQTYERYCLPPTIKVKNITKEYLVSSQEELNTFLNQLKDEQNEETAEPRKRSVCDIKVLQTHFCRPESSYINELYKKYKEEKRSESDFIQSINSYVNHNHFYNLHSIIPESNVNDEVMRFTQSLSCPIVYKSLLENDQSIIEMDKKRIMQG